MNFKKINCPVCGLIPKWLRFIIVSFGLFFILSYFGNSIKTEKFSVEDKNNQFLNSTITQVGENKKNTQVSFGNTTMSVVVADTEEERIAGLSGYDSLFPEEGMLFVFEELGIHGFWMKGMKFAIDIIWINENKEIVYVEENILPESYPKIFQPIENSLYVIEAPTGFFLKNKLKIGDKIDFSV